MQLLLSLTCTLLLVSCAGCSPYFPSHIVKKYEVLDEQSWHVVRGDVAFRESLFSGERIIGLYAENSIEPVAEIEIPENTGRFNRLTFRFLSVRGKLNHGKIGFYTDHGMLMYELSTGKINSYVKSGNEWELKRTYKSEYTGSKDFLNLGVIRLHNYKVKVRLIDLKFKEIDSFDNKFGLYFTKDIALKEVVRLEMSK